VITPGVLSDIDLVTWDVDGTLYDMSLARADLLRSVFSSWNTEGVIQTAFDLLRMGRISRRMEKIRRLGGVIRPAHRAQLDEFVMLQSRHLVPSIGRVGCLEGVEALMDCFSQRGIRQVAFSDYPCREKLVALGLSDRFVGCHDAAGKGLLKPHREAYQRVFDVYGVTAERVLHIGDRIDSDGSAQALGCKVVVVGREVTSLSDWHESMLSAEER